MNEPIKPCPFCGSQARIQRKAVHNTFDDQRMLHWVKCLMQPCGVEFMSGEWTEADAIKKWNMRSDD